MMLASRRDQGFSTVLGAMVLLGLALVAFTTYQTTLAPSIEARSEADQMATVADRLERWAAEAGVSDAGTSPTSTSLPLASSQPPFAGSPSAGTVTFTPDTDDLALAARNLSLSHLNGSAVDGTEETWHPVDGATVTEVTGVEDLRLRIDEIDSDRTGESVTVNVTDAAGEHAGQLRLAVEDPGSDGGGGQGFELVVTTRDADGDVLFDQPILISGTTHDSHSDPISPYWVNLLNGDYRFDRVLDAAEPPYEIQLAPDGLDADYTVSYAHASSGSSGDAGGLVIEGYRHTVPTGRLVFEARADQADDQTLAVEHGAVLRTQDEGAAFARSPTFTATAIGHDVHLSLAWPALTGPPDARSSDGSLLVEGTAQRTYEVRGQATNLTVNVTTQAPELWEHLFASRLTEAGLTEDRGFETARGNAWARVDVWGLLDPSPSSDRYDVHVAIQSVTTDVRVGG